MPIDALSFVQPIIIPAQRVSFGTLDETASVEQQETAAALQELGTNIAQGGAVMVFGYRPNANLNGGLYPQVYALH